MLINPTISFIIHVTKDNANIINKIKKYGFFSTIVDCFFYFSWTEQVDQDRNKIGSNIFSFLEFQNITLMKCKTDKRKLLFLETNQRLERPKLNN